MGIHDVVNFDGGKNILQHQHEDLIALGHLVIALTTLRSGNITQNLSKTLEYIGNYYSGELKNLVMLLLGVGMGKTVIHTNIEDIATVISRKLFNEVDNLYRFLFVFVVIAIVTLISWNKNSPKNMKMGDCFDC